MQYFEEINPFHEAYVYLTNRFSKKRARERIAAEKPDENIMLDDDWAKFTRIAELERDLDDAFPIDEIMERYFRPFEVREPLPQDWTLSLGSVLSPGPTVLSGSSISMG